jgi:glucokinase
VPEPRFNLVADVGGTNARFALSPASSESPVSLQQIVSLPTNDFASLAEALEHYLRGQNNPSLNAVSLAVAGPVKEGRAKFSNLPWEVDCRALASQFNFAQIGLMNDFEAIALAITELPASDVHQLGGPPMLHGPGQQLGVVGPGTGLGAAMLLTPPENRVIVTEAGHASFTPENEQQLNILCRLKADHGRVSNERVLSGKGLENIYWALSPTDERLPAAEIFSLNNAGSDPVANMAVNEFVRILGQFAGDFALTTGSYDGIFIAGGIFAQQLNSIDPMLFREAFENKGRHAALMRTIPTAVITHQQPGLLGAAIAAGTQTGPLSTSGKY